MNQPSNPTAINVPAGLNLPLWRGLVASLGVGALVFLAFSLLFALSFFNRPFIGFFMLPSGVILGGGPTSAELWTGLSAGLMRGDRLVAVNGVPINPSSDVYPQIAPILGTLRVGDPITVTVERPTREPQASFCETITRGVDRCTVTYPTMAMLHPIWWRTSSCPSSRGCSPSSSGRWCGATSAAIGKGTASRRSVGSSRSSRPASFTLIRRTSSKSCG